uniref:Uncharacterized protein n=1 Tax=Panagrolaimus sp. JU765 TaxID=591449 RepID=A0AC34R8U5_9BILA
MNESAADQLKRELSMIQKEYASKKLEAFIKEECSQPDNFKEYLKSESSLTGDPPIQPPSIQPPPMNPDFNRSFGRSTMSKFKSSVAENLEKMKNFTSSKLSNVFKMSKRKESDKK